MDIKLIKNKNLVALVICFCITIITANIDNKDFYMNYINADFYKSYELEQVLYEIATQSVYTVVGDNASEKMLNYKTESRNMISNYTTANVFVINNDSKEVYYNNISDIDKYLKTVTKSYHNVYEINFKDKTMYLLNDNNDKVRVSTNNFGNLAQTRKEDVTTYIAIPFTSDIARMKDINNNEPLYVKYKEFVKNIEDASFFIGSKIIALIIFIIAYLVILVGVVYMQISERRIPIQHSQRTDSSYNKEQSYIPLKLNSASVMPVIFASALTSIPTLIAQFVKNTEFQNIVNNYLNYTTLTGYILYIVLIFAFGYVYTLMELNPKEMSENLDKNRSYIPGITPGEKTEMFLKGTISRLTVDGSLFLIVIASIPILFSKVSSLSSAVTLGGTGLLIVVGVALETYKQLESSVVSRSYQGSRKRRHRR